jgi:uncharacterized protein (DUF2252 family)
MTARIEDSAARGREVRRELPRRSHGVLNVPAERPDPVAVLEEQARTRAPQLIPIRYGRMLVSPFTFFRGAAAIMAGDLAAVPNTGLTVQCCGDAHLSNFGLFASADRRLVFDLNDFDETLPGPFDWDVKRLAASVLIAAQDNGFRPREQERAVLATVGAYRERMSEFAAMDNLSVWYARMEVAGAVETYAPQLTSRVVKSTQKMIAKAQTRDHMSAFSKWTEPVDGGFRIVDQSPLITPIDKLAGDLSREDVFARLEEIIRVYRESLPYERRVLIDQFRLIDVAHKVVGVGSVGTQSWIALMLGYNDTEPLFLQIKEAQASVLEAHLGASEFSNHGQRVVVGQRLMQASSDVFLGWLHVVNADGTERDYYGRQLRDWKGSAEIEELRPEGLEIYGQVCGRALARAHARTGDRVAIAAYLGASDRFDRAILSFSQAYAEQNEQDYSALQDAVRDGRVVAQTGS